MTTNYAEIHKFKVNIFFFKYVRVVLQAFYMYIAIKLIKILIAISLFVVYILAI